MLCELQAEGGSSLALPGSHTPQPLVGYPTASLPREAPDAPCTVATLALPPPTANLRGRGLPSCRPPPPWSHFATLRARNLPKASRGLPSPAPVLPWPWPPGPPSAKPTLPLGTSHSSLLVRGHWPLQTCPAQPGRHTGSRDSRPWPPWIKPSAALLGSLPWPRDGQHLGPWALEVGGSRPLQPPCPFTEALYRPLTAPVSPPAFCGGTPWPGVVATWGHSSGQRRGFSDLNVQDPDTEGASSPTP